MIYNRQKAFEAIRRACIADDPTIMDLRFGCEVSYGSSRVAGVIMGENQDGYGVADSMKRASETLVRDVDIRDIRGRPIILQDVLKSAPMDDGLIDHSDGNIAFISVDAKTSAAERVGFQWQLAKSLTDQSDETIQFLSELLSM